MNFWASPHPDTRPTGPPGASEFKLTHHFCYAKKKTVQKDKTILERNPDAGDIGTWTAIDADSKLCMSWFVGARDAATAFMHGRHLLHVGTTAAEFTRRCA